MKEKQTQRIPRTKGAEFNTNTPLPHTQISPSLIHLLYEETANKKYPRFGSSKEFC